MKRVAQQQQNTGEQELLNLGFKHIEKGRDKGHYILDEGKGEGYQLDVYQEEPGKWQALLYLKRGNYYLYSEDVDGKLYDSPLDAAKTIAMDVVADDNGDIIPYGYGDAAEYFGKNMYRKFIRLTEDINAAAEGSSSDNAGEAKPETDEPLPDGYSSKQCKGKTQDGEQCKNMVVVKDGEEPYCHIHEQQKGEKKMSRQRRDFIAGYMAGYTSMKKASRTNSVKNLRKKAGWGDFSNPVADRMNEMFLPSRGDGENMANQIATAINKLVYKWFNDGDVFDNVHTGLEGWANDISGSANWLYRYIPDSKPYLERAFEPISEAEYEAILYDLFHVILCDEDLMLRYSELPKVGDAYGENGPFCFVDYDDDWGDEEDDYYW